LVAIDSSCNWWNVRRILLPRYRFSARENKFML
jgi:hypothetical protein